MQVLESLLEELAVLQEAVKSLEELKTIQCSTGNWDFDAYMHGMANGLILAVSILKNKTPEYLDAPEEWLVDKPCTEVLAQAEVSVQEDKNHE